MSFETAYVAQSSRERGDDRVAVIEDGDRTVIVVADGAGGSGSGDLAADTVIREVQTMYRHTETADQWVAALGQIDSRIGLGEATTVVVDLRPERLCGASVGDSRAVFIDDGELHELTASQQRKPLLGSQEAVPVGFSRQSFEGLLLVGTDGFWNYVKRETLPRAVAAADFFTIPRLCVEMVRLPSGELWDDIAVVACRQRVRPRTRQRYSI